MNAKPENNASFIQTYSGRKLDFRNPDPEAITLEDIAHALSQIVRFGGHISRFYSVADHSLNVARLVAWGGGTRQDTLCALLHDASESLIGDIVTPLKHILPQAMELEKKLSSMIFQKFGIDESRVDFAAVKKADETMLVIEAKALFNFPPLDNWTDAINVRPLRFKPFISSCPKEAEMNFLSAVRTLLDDSPRPAYGPEWRDAEKELPKVEQRCEVAVMACPTSPGTVMRAMLVRQGDNWGKYVWVNGENPYYMVSCVRKWRPLD